MSNVTWADKVDGATDATGTVTAADMNVIKTAANSKKGFQSVASKAALNAAIIANSSEIRDIFVQADETQDNRPTQYLYTGSTAYLTDTF